jgi:hypothetical protein
VSARLKRLLVIFLVPPFLCLLAGFAAYRYVAYHDLAARLDDAGRAKVMAPLRAVVDGQVPQAVTPTSHARMVVVSLWSLGVRVARVVGEGPSLEAAVEHAASQLAADPGLTALDAPARQEARLQVDVVRGTAPLVTRWEVTSALGVVPGLDGIGTTDGKRRWVFVPDELVERKLLGSLKLLPMVPEFKIGLDLAHADPMLGAASKAPPGTWGASKRSWYRFRTDTFVERPEAERAGAPLPLFRGRPPAPALSAESLRAAAVLGGEYLMSHLHENGRYYYEVDLTTGKASDPTSRTNYNLPRHAGTSYYLSELYEVTQDPRLKEALNRAFDHMVLLIREGGCEGKTPEGKTFQCVVDKGQATASLGSTALGVIAIAEYRLASGDPRYDETLRAMAEWIVSLHKPNGKFAHLYDVRTHTPNWEKELLYYDGEAALALIRAYRVLGDKRYLDAAEKALDALVTTYDFFLGQFFFGEEHWTCIAAEAGWPELKNDRYREFCSDYARFLRAQQFVPGEVPGQEDLTGSYSVTPFFVPHNTPAGSRSEAMISAWLLGKYHGRPEEAIRRQVLSAMTYLLGQQIRADSDWFTPAAEAYGAMPTSTTDRNVRIDYVQHTCSAMLRSIELLDPGKANTKAGQ